LVVLGAVVVALVMVVLALLQRLTVQITAEILIARLVRFLALVAGEIGIGVAVILKSMKRFV
jgi:hypothetical protein